MARKSVERSEPPDGPRTTEILVGHEAAERALLETWRAGRLGHAWIIGGSRGIGKSTLAYRLARRVLAGPPDAAAGDLALGADDPVFRRVAAGAHPDLMTAERSLDDNGRLRGEIVVADVRRLIAFFGKTASAGGWRVAIVDSADELNRSAANALLKVLEEPPKDALLLLVAHAPGSLPATIRSRCRTLMLKPLDETAVARLLASEHPDADAGHLAAIARLAEGSAGRALEIAGHDGLALYRELLSLANGIPRLDVKALHVFCDRLAPAAAEPRYRLATMLIERLIGRLVRSGAGVPLAEAVPGEGEVTARLAALGGLDRWLEVWEKVAGLIASADRVNLDRKSVLITAFTALEGAGRG